jgi:alkylation response protein AidB-like acyl-CoA dehydrogenase
MDFRLSDQQKNLQWAAGEFARGEFAPELAVELDQAGRFPEEAWKKACRLGLIGVHYPKKLGGLGLGFFETVLVTEALCRADCGFGSAIAAADRGVEIVLNFGSDPQRERTIPAVVRGEKRLAFVSPGSERIEDPAVCLTGEHVLRGMHGFVPNAPAADEMVVICRDAEGLTTFMVEAGRPGMEIQRVESMGRRMIPSGRVFFRDVAVAPADRLGGAGDAAAHVRTFFTERTLKGLAESLGACEGAFDRALRYGRRRAQFGRPISAFQMIRHKLAEMAVGIEVVRSMTYRLGSDYDGGRLHSGLLAAAAIEARRKVVRISDETVQIFGGSGYLSEQEPERWFRDAWAIAAELGHEEDEKDAIWNEGLVVL